MKTMRMWFTGMLLSWLISGAYADELFDQANTFYGAGQFKEAAQAYEEILQEAGPQVGVLQNLGSSYYRLGDDAQAILAFERALLLKPRDPDLRANLKLAQEEAAVFPVVRDEGGQVILEYFSSQEWARFGLGAAVFLVFLAVAWVSCFRKYRWTGLVLACCGVLILGVSLYALSLRGDESLRGIVTGSPADVKISPFEKAETRGTLAAGREVKLGKEESGYQWVTTDAGTIDGWVKKELLARIVPEE